MFTQYLNSRVQSFLLCLFCAVNLSACAGFFPQRIADDAAQTSWKKRASYLQQVDAFSLNGRIAASGAQSGKANINWQQKQDQFSVTLSGPFKIGAVELTGTPFRVTVNDGDDTYNYSSPEEALRRIAGWSLPLAQLRYWVLGIPAPEFPAEPVFDELQRISYLEQGGWKITFEEYRSTDVSKTDMPRRITLRPIQQTEGAPAQALRLVVDEWRSLNLR